MSYRRLFGGWWHVVLTMVYISNIIIYYLLWVQEQDRTKDHEKVRTVFKSNWNAISKKWNLLWKVFSEVCRIIFLHQFSPNYDEEAYKKYFDHLSWFYQGIRWKKLWNTIIIYEKIISSLIAGTQLEQKLSKYL